jgi:anaerobic selenocysteine-containing dehydrogenase
VEVHPADAERLGLATGDDVVLANERGEVSIRAFLSENVRQGTLVVPLLYDGGAVTALFASTEEMATQVSLRVAAAV